MMLIDPHGDLAERVAQAIPAHRRQDLIYFNVPDPTQPFGYNPLKHVRDVAEHVLHANAPCRRATIFLKASRSPEAASEILSHC
jgi:hypothetical protein